MNKCRYCKKILPNGATLCDSPLCAAKRELSEYKYLIKEAEDMQEEIARLKSRANGCTIPIQPSSGQNGTKNNAFESHIIAYLDLKNKYEKICAEAFSAADIILTKIRELESPYKDILRMKYIHNRTFEKIAVELNYDYRWIIRLYNRALEQYYKIDH